MTDEGCNFTIGIEEECLPVDRVSPNLAEVSEGLRRLRPRVGFHAARIPPWPGSVFRERTL